MYKFGVGKRMLYENNLDRIVNVEPEEAGSPALKEDAKKPTSADMVQLSA